MTTNAAGSPARHRARRIVAGLLSTAVAASGLVALGVATAPTASAAPISVTNASFTWSINNEVNAGAFAPGTWNLMSAGKIADPGAGGQVLNSADSGATWGNAKPAGWKNTSGNVTIEDQAADGSYAPTTFQGTRTNSAGQTTSGASSTILAETRMTIKNGAGSLDAATDTASLTWDGDATILFYSGMTFFYLSDPKLTLTGGAGTVTATVGGYATSMDDSSQWEPVPDKTVTIATLSGVDVTPTGLAATPAYREVVYDAPEGSSAQVTTGSNWGAFPQEFVDFQQTLGQGPYWYSTGGVADPRKIANPLSVSYSEFPQATVVVSDTDFLPNGSREITVTGSGFNPAWATGTRAPLAGKPAGTYVAFGKYATTWRPSAGAASATRKNGSVKWAVSASDMEAVGGAAAGAIELTPQGTFSATLTIDKAVVDKAATTPDLTNYGIYTYAGGGSVQAAYETYTPVTFTKAKPTVALTSANVTYGTDASATVNVVSDAGAAGSVTLSTGTTKLGTADLTAGTATFALGKLAAGSHLLTASYAGTDNIAAGTATATLVVARAGSTTKVKVTKKPKPKQAGKATVTVTSPSGAVAGATKVVLKNAQGKTVKGVKAGAVKNGKATVKLPRLATGKYTLTVAFAGDANVARSAKKVSFRVA
jgi:hypothetical protein